MKSYEYGFNRKLLSYDSFIILVQNVKYHSNYAFEYLYFNLNIKKYIFYLYITALWCLNQDIFT